MNSTDLIKRRDILFASFPPGQVPEAVDALQRAGMALEVTAQGVRAIEVRYDLRDTCLHDIEDHLEATGFHLDNSLFCKLTRAFLRYVEETQRHNLGAPEKRLKRTSARAYVHAWEHHPHGDHDDTPPEWRGYR